MKNENANKSNDDSKISGAFFRVASKISDIDKKSECELNNESYVNAEMRVVKLIKEHEGVHVTRLAEMLGVTKGAVSQTALKLEKRGILTKEKDPDNQSRLMLTLTPKGEKLYYVHEAFHKELDDLISETLSGATEENRIFLKSFLDTLETKILDIYIK